MRILKYNYEFIDPNECSEHRKMQYGVGTLGWRSSIDVDKFWIAFETEVLSIDGGWRPVGNYFSIAITKSWSFGEDHFWYDGPHCSFSIGFLHISWSTGSCKKCLGEK